MSKDVILLIEDNFEVRENTAELLELADYDVVTAANGKKGVEKALEHATRAIELSGDTAPDKYFYAQATQLEGLGKKSEAIAAYKKITGEKYKAQAEYKISELGG